MPPPPFSALKPGSTLVNIILKADQPTGKLTSGVVAEILTRGDHPRGVKVRLVDGRVGRVQRVLESGAGTPTAAAGVENAAGTSGGDEKGDSGPVSGRGSRSRRDHVAFDLRHQDKSEVVTSSLMDFVRPPKQKRRGRGKAEGVDEGEGNRNEDGLGNGDLEVDNDGDAGGGDDGTATAQRLLEKEFPSIDTALVAAILLDHEGDVEAARGTLGALI